MVLQRNLSIIGLFLWAIAPAEATPLANQDLLRGLPPAIRAEVLSGADANTLCQYQVLEKEFGLRFESGTPTTDANAPDSSACTDGKTSSARIAKAEDLKNIQKRSGWLFGSAAYCTYKKQLKSALERAARKLKENENYAFVQRDDVLGGALCAFSKNTLKLWQPIKNSYCIAVSGNTSTALECFYNEPCRLDCGAGAVNLQMLGAYELFAGADGMDVAERKRFDRYYESLALGPFNAPDPGGIEETANPFESSKVIKKPLKIANQAALGPLALTGLRIAIVTKDSYQSQFSKSDLTGQAELNSNAILLSTSAEGAREFTRRQFEGEPGSRETTGVFETDSAALTRALVSLSFMKGTDGDPLNENNWRAYEQVVAKINYEKIVNGSYVLRSGNAADQAAYQVIRTILAKPLYRDTQIYIHPHGVSSLGAAMLDKNIYHHDAPFSFVTFPSAEDEHFERFVNSRIDRCLESRH